VIPTLIVGGYLGAGKTTLVNHLLRHADGRRIAVMVNDFGELTIDADLIEGAEGSVLALAGGCVCCSFGSDLLGALQDVLQRQPPPDLILIETSGVALPAAVARSARLLPGLSIEGIVLMLDAETVRQRSADPYVGDLVRQQLLDADLLILNKTELCSPTQLTELNAWLPSMTTAGTPVVAASQARVPPELVLGFQAGLSTGLDAATGDALARWAAQPIGQPTAPASDRFVNELLELTAPLDPQQLLAALTAPDAGVVRAKGWLTDLTGQRHLLQQVGRRAELLPLAPDARPPGPDRLLVIGLAGVYRYGKLLLNK
jgi:G3E family GTPase